MKWQTHHYNRFPVLYCGQTLAPRAVFELSSPRADKDRIAVKRSEGESADVLELRSMLNAYGGI